MKVRWLSHTAVRYAAIIVVATLIPLGIVILAYDRYASSLLDTLSGRSLEQRIAVMHGRLASFLEARFAQLDTLANYPGLANAFARDADPSRSTSVRAVLEYEADNPDLYGVLVFGGDETLLDAIPSQAAAGAPYWGGSWEPLRQPAPRIAVARGEVIGPFAPAEGQPGSFLLLRRMPGEADDGKGTAIALHVRLSSLTELMWPDELGGVVRPLLVTPKGAAYSAVGLPESVSADVVDGPELLEGWKVVLAMKDTLIAEPLSRIREALLGAALGVLALVAGLAAFLGARANRRIARLVAGSAALAEGKLDTRIVDEGEDELGVLAHAFNRMASRQRDTLSGAVQAEKMAVLGRFATSFAHEVRNPLAAVKTSVESMRMTERDTPRKRLLGGIDEEIDRLDDILKGFLAYARPTPPSPRPLRIEDVLKRVELLVAHQLQDAGISFAAVGEIGLDVVADASHLQQILMNLIANAIDAMPRGGRLTVRVRRSDEKAIVEISDTGNGIAPDRIDQMMEPFVTTRAGGSGLGLPISRQLAEMNGGSLYLAGAPGEGATAILVLPRAMQVAT
jgi:two-component system sensor histidine kinase AtoS